MTVKQGVPQGSILGPVLFLLFVNDMPLHEQKSTMDNYADDTTLSLSFKLENPTITKSIFVTGPEWKREMGQREQNVYEYAKN